MLMIVTHNDLRHDATKSNENARNREEEAMVIRKDRALELLLWGRAHDGRLVKAG